MERSHRSSEFPHVRPPPPRPGSPPGTSLKTTTFLLDTDVLIECLRGHVRLGSELKRLAQEGALLAVSPVTIAELHAGVRPEEVRAITDLLRTVMVLPISDRVGELAGRLLHRHAKSHGLRLADALIAATALHHDAALFTLNVRHFSRLGIALHRTEL